MFNGFGMARPRINAMVAKRRSEIGEEMPQGTRIILRPPLGPEMAFRSHQIKCDGQDGVSPSVFRCTAIFSYTEVYNQTHNKQQRYTMITQKMSLVLLVLKGVYGVFPLLKQYIISCALFLSKRILSTTWFLSFLKHAINL